MSLRIGLVFIVRVPPGQRQRPSEGRWLHPAVAGHQGLHRGGQHQNCSGRLGGRRYRHQGVTALHGNGVRTVVIEKLDRLAPDLMVQEATIADLQKHGFTLVSVAEPDLMANDPSRILMR